MKHLKAKNIPVNFGSVIDKYLKTIFLIKGSYEHNYHVLDLLISIIQNMSSRIKNNQLTMIE